MDSLITVIGPIAIVMLTVFGLLVAFLYLLLPFAIFGIKPLLSHNNGLLIKQNHLLKSQNELLNEQVLTLNALFKTPKE